MPQIFLPFGNETLSAHLLQRNLQAVLQGAFPPAPSPEEERAELLRSLCANPSAQSRFGSWRAPVCG